MANKRKSDAEVVRQLRTASKRSSPTTGGRILTGVHALDALSHGNVQASDAITQGCAKKIMPLPCGAFLALDDHNGVLGVGMSSERERPCPRSVVSQLAHAAIIGRNLAAQLLGFAERNGATYADREDDVERIRATLKSLDAALSPFAESDEPGDCERPNLVPDEGALVEEVRTCDGVPSDERALQRGDAVVHSEVLPEGDDEYFGCGR